MYNRSIKLFFFFFILISCDLFKTQNDENQTLIKTNWELLSFNSIFQSPIHVRGGEYTILFSDTGTVQSKVDCNWCFGEFTLGDRKSISIHLEICTEAYCGDDSKDKYFHQAIENTTRYAINGNTLRLYFGNNYLNFSSKSN